MISSFLSLLKPWLVINRKRTIFSIAILCLLFGLLAGIHSTMSQLEGRFLFAYHETHRLDNDGYKSGYFSGNWGRWNKTWNPPTYEDWLLLRTEFELIFKSAGLNNYIRGTDFVCQCYLMNASMSNHYEYILLYSLPPSQFAVLSSLLVDGTLPKKSNEVLYCQTADPQSLESFLGRSMIVNGDPGWREEEFLYCDNQTLQITGVLSPMTLDLLARQNIVSEDILGTLNPYETFLLTREDFFFEFLGNFSYYYHEVIGEFEIRFDFSSYEVTGELLKNAGRKLISRQSLYVPLLYYSFEVDLIDFAEDFSQDFESTKLTFLGFGLPVLSMGVVLVLKTASYGARQRREETQLLHRKGITLAPIRSVMLVELGIRLLVSVVVGSLVGLVVGDLFGSQEIVADVTIIPNTLLDYFHSESVFLMIFLGLIGGFLWITDHNLAREVKSDQYSTIAREEIRPAWIKHFWDVIGLTLGFAGVLGVIWAEDFFETQLSESPSGIETFFRFIGYSFLFLIFLSIMLLCLRGLGILTRKIGTLVWDRSKDTMTLPFWRFSRGVSDHWGSLTVLSLLILLVVSGFGLVENSQYHAHESAYFRVGSDIRLNTGVNRSETLVDEIWSISDVSEVTVVTRALWNTQTCQVRALIISPDSFSRTMHQFRSDSLGLSNIKHHLQNLQKCGYVIVDRGSSKSLDWSSRANHSFGLTLESGGPVISLYCEAIYDRFPDFMLEEDRVSSGAGFGEFDPSIVMSRSTWDVITNQSSHVSIFAQEILIKLKNPDRSSEVLDTLVKDLGVKGDSWEDFLKTRHSMASFILPQIFTVFIIISLTSAIAVFATDAFAIRYKRRDQLEFIDLLGIEEKTEKLLALTEFGFEIFLCAIFAAVPIYFLSELSFILLTVREDVLPFLPVFKWGLSVLLALAVVILTIITWGISYCFFGRGVDYEHRQE